MAGKGLGKGRELERSKGEEIEAKKMKNQCVWSMIL